MLKEVNRNSFILSVHQDSQKSIHPLSLRLIHWASQGGGVCWRANPSWHWARGGVQDASVSQHTETNKPFPLTFTRINLISNLHVFGLREEEGVPMHTRGDHHTEANLGFKPSCCEATVPTPPTTELLFHGNPSNHFCIILLTNKQTSKKKRVTWVNEVKKNVQTWADGVSDHVSLLQVELHSPGALCVCVCVGGGGTPHRNTHR